MNERQPLLISAALLAGTLAATSAHAVDSGSTGVDGALAPVVDVGVGLPPGGILNYTTINIPSGVTVTFLTNASNAPAVVLVQGDAVIDGNIDVAGKNGTGVGRQGGPGGFAGGLGGGSSSNGGNGFGPGGGPGGVVFSSLECGGTGGGFALAGNSPANSNCQSESNSDGSQGLVPLIGGSGGGGGRNVVNSNRAGNGGGGGGALLLAASGTVTLNGTIDASGGVGGNSTFNVGAGGGGSGGAVRIVATALAGTGSVDVSGGNGGSSSSSGGNSGGAGSFGRIKLEADLVQGAIATLPAGVGLLTGPSDIFPANLPVVRIATIDGVPVPSQPNGVDDVVLPSGIVNPVAIGLTASNVPLGNTIQLTMTPPVGAPESTLSDALTGTVESSTATASITLPQGPSVLTAAVSFTITAANGDLMDGFSNFAMGEPVERVEVVTALGEGASTRFVTRSGNVYTWPSNALAAY